jgi:pimeloyl-ACP methyl ester carboxylesterase
MIFLHGWPSIGLFWRSQMDALAADGWHCVAPDLRGYGGSCAPAANDAYTIREVVADMAELHDHPGGKTAIWVGHDWGSVVAGALAAHEPKRSRGVVLTSWAYFPDANSLATLVPLVDRTIYPAGSIRMANGIITATTRRISRRRSATSMQTTRQRCPRSIELAAPMASETSRRQQRSRAPEHASAPRTVPRRLHLTRLSGRRKTSTC